RIIRDDDIGFETLLDNPLVVIAGVDNAWARRRKISLAELLNEPWTWPPPESAFNSIVVEAFHALGLPAPVPAVYTHCLNMRFSLAAATSFLAIVPRESVNLRSKFPSIKILPVELPTTHRPVGVITLKNRVLSPLAQVFLDCAREIAKPLAKARIIK